MPQSMAWNNLELAFSSVDILCEGMVTTMLTHFVPMLPFHWDYLPLFCRIFYENEPLPTLLKISFCFTCLKYLISWKRQTIQNISRVGLDHSIPFLLLKFLTKKLVPITDRKWKWITYKNGNETCMSFLTNMVTWNGKELDNVQKNRVNVLNIYKAKYIKITINTIKKNTSHKMFKSSYYIYNKFL